LAYEYLGRADLVHVLDKPKQEPKEEDLDWDEEMPTIGERKHELSGMRVVGSSKPVVSARQEDFIKPVTSLDAVNAAAKSMQGDAPACNVCGHITIRSGTCYKCLNCGNSLGCS
jgi:ribonucleoside-diphosphate reductase alpha chain